MKKIVFIFTAVVLCILTFVSTGDIQKTWEPVEAAETTRYAIEEIKNLQEFLLAKETPNLSDKDYDLNNDDRWDVLIFV